MRIESGRRRAQNAAAWGIAVGALWVMTASAQGPRQGLPPLVPESLVGSVSFDLYCASCHGRQGRGDGPMAGQLRRIPPNLTTFATRNGGVFPAERVRQVIDGTGVASHGDRDMPLWGAVFKRLPVGGSGAEDRIDAVVRFLQEIQERPAE